MHVLLLTSSKHIILYDRFAFDKQQAHVQKARFVFGKRKAHVQKARLVFGKQQAQII